MRLAPHACLLIVLLAPITARATIIHHSNHLVDAPGVEVLNAFDINDAGDIFVLAWLDSLDSIGGDAVGPGDIIARLDPHGNVAWTRNIARTIRYLYEPPSLLIEALPDGGVVIASDFVGAVDPGGGWMSSVGGDDIFLLKLDSDGVVQWQRHYGGNLTDRVRALVVGDDGSIVLTGSFMGLASFGGGSFSAGQIEPNVFLAKIDGDGQHVWSHAFPGEGYQSGRTVFTGPGGRVGLVCDFAGTSIDLGGGTIVNQGWDDVCVGVYEADGSLAWSLHGGGPGVEGARGIAIDRQGNVTVCGILTSTIDVGGITLRPVARAPFATGFVASFSAEGAPRWSYSIPDTTGSDAFRLDVDNAGRSFVAGRNQSTILFGSETIEKSSVLVLAFDTAGEPLGAVSENVSSMALRADRARDRILLAGTVWGPVEFAGQTLETQKGAMLFATFGWRGPPQVAITRFEARADGDGVRVAWNITSADDLGSYSLTRRMRDRPEARIMARAPAHAGESVYIDRSASPGSSYTYGLTVTTALGDEVYSAPASINVPYASNVLEQNTPNPFNPLTTFAYALSGPADVSIVIYDTHGAVIARLGQGVQPAGRHTATWGGHNVSGELVASGVYYYRLEGVPGVGARKMLLLK